MVERKLKNSFIGYKKEDVHAYVAELDREMKAKIAMFEENLEAAAKEAEAINENHARALKGKEQRIDELVSARATSDRELEEARIVSDDLTRKLNHANEEIARQLKELEALKLKNAELLERVSHLEEERDLIPAVLINAETKAEEVLNKAKKKADEVINEAAALADKKVLTAENERKKIEAESEEFRRKVIVSRQNLIAAMSAYKKALDDALSQ